YSVYCIHFPWHAELELSFLLELRIAHMPFGVALKDATALVCCLEEIYTCSRETGRGETCGRTS
ncbi:hypothetical protein ACJX0J_033897, partial [Zea mays]